jgi:two-component system response regulator RegX3
MTAAQATPSEDHADWPRLLVVEDDESHLLALSVGLEREHFAVTALADGREALDAIAELQPDLILLDVMLPGISGIDICRELRAHGDATPIIFVSSRSEELDVVVGIEVGADDYVAKPYRMRELVARISALLRRQRRDEPAGGVAPRPAPIEGEVLQVGEVSLDRARHEVRLRGEPMELPLREFQLLRELLEQAGRVVTREQLLERVWGLQYDGDPRIVATLVGRLRARLGDDPDEPTHITTIRGVGYRFNDR